MDASLSPYAHGNGSGDTRFQRYLNSLTSFEEKMTDFFGELGYFVAKHPRKVQLATAVFTFFSCLGFLNTVVETRPEKLWVLSGGRSIDELAYVTEVWGAPPRTMLIYWESDSGGGSTDVLNSEFMDIAAHMHRELETIRTSSNTSFQDLCFLMPPEFRGDQLNLSVAPASSPCFVYSPLEFWPLPFSNLTTTLCSDVSSTLIQQYTRVLPPPLNTFTDCAEAVLAAGTGRPPKGSPRHVTCDMEIPLPAWLMESAGIDLQRDLHVRDLCPVKCGGCPHSAFSAMPTVSVQDTNGLQADSRVQTLTEQEMDVLAVGCLDAPASVIAGLSNGLMTGCAELIRTFDGRCDATLQVSDEQAAAAQASAAALLAQYGSGVQIPADYGSNDACWDGVDFTFDRCCDLNVSPTGDASCWTGDFSFNTCCLGGTQALTPAMVCPKTCNECREGDLLIGTSERAEPPAPPATPEPSRTLPLLTVNAALTLTKWGSEQLMGHRTLSSNGAIVGATALRSTYILDCGGRMGGDITECVELESLWMDYLNEVTSSGRLGDVRVAYYSIQGQYLETIRSMVSAGPLFGCSLLLMLMYIASALGKFGDMAKHSKMLVGLIGTFNVVLSTVIAFGLCSGVGIMVTPCSPIVPFLLLGIGIDDMFVVVRSIELVPEGIPTEQRIKLAMRSCGGSITVTTVTDAVAFLIGATIRFPAMKTFCIHAAVGITVVFILTCTFVVAALAISDKGMNGDPAPIDQVIYKARKIDVSGVDRRTTIGGTPEPASNITRDILKKYWAPFVLDGSDNDQLKVLGVFAVIGWVGVWGALQMEEGFDIMSMLNSDSYVTDNYVTGEVQFRDVYYPFQVVLREGTNYEDPAIRAEAEHVAVQLEAVENVRTDVSNWIKAYEESNYFDARMPFVSGVHAFLNSEEGLQYSQDVAYKEGSEKCAAVDAAGPTAEATCHSTAEVCAYNVGEPGDTKTGTAAVPPSCFGQIKASRLTSYFPADIKTAEAQESIVAEVRDIVDSSKLDGFIFSTVMFVWEVWSVMLEQLIVNLIQTFVAIFIGTNVFLFHPTIAIIICLNVVMVEFELMALCALFGIQLNTVTMCIFIMNFGLVFDYSAHISHMFMTTGGTKKQRAAVSVTDMGSGVFNGAFTTGEPASQPIHPSIQSPPCC
jgi:predicted RND superfamily exporter protein